MEIVLAFSKVATPVAYGISMWFYAKLFLASDESKWSKAASRTFVIAWVIHTLLLILLSANYRNCPLSTWGEGLLFSTWLLAIIHFVSEWISGTQRLSAFILTPITLGCAIGVFFIKGAYILPEELRSAYFNFHIAASLTAYACFSMSSVLASLYLVLHRRLKLKQFDIAFRKLPPLDKLDKLAATWAVLGSLLMILASAIGYFWVFHKGLEGMRTREAAILLALVIYLGAALTRFSPGFRGKRHAITLLIAFAILLIGHFLHSHGYAG